MRKMIEPLSSNVPESANGTMDQRRSATSEKPADPGRPADLKKPADSKKPADPGRPADPKPLKPAKKPGSLEIPKPPKRPGPPKKPADPKPLKPAKKPGSLEIPKPPKKPKPPKRPGPPVISAAVLAAIVLGCIFAELISGQDPFYMSPGEITQPPGTGHLFGTDTLGRDLFAVIWHGGRLSLAIGIAATLITTFIAVVYGTLSGLANRRIDDVMMRFSEILMSVPQILFVLFFTALMGGGNILSISVAIGISGWMPIAKMVRSEVRQLKSAGFVLAARMMGGGFFYILRKHLMPNFMSQIAYMIVSHIGSAIATEATLSFLGLGLSTEVISWGTLLSLSQNAVLTGAWWLLLIPGAFLVVTILCITEIAEYMRIRGRRDRLPG